MINAYSSLFVHVNVIFEIAVGYTTTGSTYGYGRAGVTGYDASKTYYQQAAAGQTQGYPAAAGYDQTATPKTAYNTTAYAQRTTAQAQAQPQVCLLFLFFILFKFYVKIQKHTTIMDKTATYL